MIQVRTLNTVPEFTDAVRLQKQVWGFAEIELLPVRLFVVASKIGGQVFGAYDGDKMVGFCVAIPGIKPNGLTYLHSHMLGVLPEYNDRGIGRALKQAQRNEALLREIALVEWTFDPLEIKNAYFNIERLGAVVRRFVLNQYGTTSSQLHGGLPTDRCVAEWWIASLRAEAAEAGQRPELKDVRARISVPADVARLRKKDPQKARQIQKKVSEEFLRNFDRGLAVLGFERSETEGTYLLGPWKLE
jgi:predicted GNAT superfamily acetyltransferase